MIAADPGSEPRLLTTVERRASLIEATGIDGDQANDTTAGAGAVYVFERAGASWAQQAYVKASNPGISDRFGIGLALSANGSTLVIAADRERSKTTVVRLLHEARIAIQELGRRYVEAGLTIVLKGLLIPWFLMRVVDRVGILREIAYRGDHRGFSWPVGIY